MKKSLNAPKKEVQLWLNLSQTASPNGKHDSKSHSTFHSRHTMIHPEACNFLAMTAACNNLSSCLFSFVTFFCVLISFFFIFANSISGPLLHHVHRVSILLAWQNSIFGKTVLPTIPIFTFCSDHCETSINANQHQKTAIYF